MLAKQMHVSSLSLISSVTCNLNCSFCYLNKNKSYKEFDKLVHKAWQDGSYITNVLETFSALELDPLDIEMIQLWGGEVLLRVDDVTKNVEQIIKNFPNVKTWKISTNWMIDVEKTFALIKSIEQYSIVDKVQFDIQVSIDGPPGPITDAGHHGNWDTYRKNFQKFTNLINNYKFRKINITMHINATVGKELYLNIFSDYEQINSYMRYMANFAKEIDEMCISESIQFSQMLIYPGYATPYRDTAADGRKLTEIFRLWDQVCRNEFSDYPMEIGFFLGIGDFSKNHSMFEQNMECSELSHALTINYDGSICECSGSYIDAFEPYLQELLANNQMNEYYTSLAHNRMSAYNPRLLDKTELERKKWAIHTGGYRENKATILHMMFSVAHELALSGQISAQYIENKDLLLKHCLLLLNCISCSRNNVIDTHVPYLIPVGALRRYLNGAMDFVYEKGMQHLKNEMGQCKMEAKRKNEQR